MAGISGAACANRGRRLRIMVKISPRLRWRFMAWGVPWFALALLLDLARLREPSFGEP
jgi:hypothetical protein